MDGKLKTRSQFLSYTDLSKPRQLKVSVKSHMKYYEWCNNGIT